MGIEDTRRRPQTTDEDIDAALQEVITMLSFRLDEKGRGIFMSSHEILGIIKEEFSEFSHTVKDNDTEAQKKELIDIAVAAIFGIISISSGKMDW